ncbi:MAG: YjbQ family protein [Candidatus Diapherotrites archaeon]|nr:YjbQ family protein [Candidatus Diapherotrites archaeon]
MRVLFEELVFATKRSEQIVDITGDVRAIVNRWGVSNGLLVLFSPHATASIVLNEAEPGLERDILNLFRLIAPSDEDYHHNRIDNNAHAHLRSVAFPPYVVIPVRDGKLLLGAWQRIMFVENDGPRARRAVIVQYVGE